jgi:membrane-bound lytic murein transglycosylase A
MRALVLTLALAAALSGCTLFETRPDAPERPQPEPINPVTPPPAAPPPSAPITPTPAPQPAPPVAPEPTPAPPAPVELGKPQPVAMPWLKKADWSDLPGWRQDDLAQAWGAFLQSCRGLRSNPSWIPVCHAAAKLPAQPDTAQVRGFLEQRFQPWQSNQAEGGVEGLVTGYYEPLLRGSRTPSPQYPFPLRSPPQDLLVIDLASVYPELKNLRLRGRIQGNKVVPYYTRGEIETGAAPAPGKELVWVDDPVELFFLQVQGSGRVQFENGEVMRVGYADQNGHPYKSIGKWLVEKGELTLDKASMQGIKDWGRRNPQRLAELLNSNPSYV